MRYTTIIFSLFLFYSANSSSGSVTVVELFTSQGCNSCPIADGLLGKLKQQPNTIALACHVTYWNYLGWKDTFSLPFCDRRQHSYQAYLQGRAGVYTPQMLINGRYATVGVNENRVQRLIAKAQQQNPPLAINISQTTATHLSIELPPTPLQKQQQVFLLGTSGEHQIPIKRGENSGKTLDYHNPVVEVVKLGKWDGQGDTITYPLNNQPHVREWVVIVQQYPLGNITGAGKLTLD